MPHILIMLQAWLSLWIRRWTKPNTSLVSGAVFDLMQSKQQLMLENAMLYKQLIILRRQIERHQLTNADRRWLIVLASRIQHWRETLIIVQPDTLLRWHRELFRLFWKHRSKVKTRQPGIPKVTIELIQTMATDNLLWGAERIRGELLHLGIRVSKRTILKYMRCVRKPRVS